MSQDPGINAALLNMCTKLRDPEAAPGPTVPQGRQEEDYTWLREAMASVESPERQVKRILASMEKPDAEVPLDQLLAELEELSDLVEDINWATEFALMNGPARVLATLGTDRPHITENSEVRMQLALVLAHAAQLNEDVQGRCAAAGWEKVLLPMMRKEASTSALAALVLACSCVCRSSLANCSTFIQSGGVDLLTSLLSAAECHRTNTKVVCRVLFFVSSLAAEGISSTGLLRSTCEQAAESEEELVQCAAAQVLLEVAAKKPAEAKEVIHTYMPSRWAEWRSLGKKDEDCDARQELVSLMDRVC